MKKKTKQHRKENTKKELVKQLSLCRKYQKEFRKKSLKIQEQYDRKFERCYNKIDSCLGILNKKSKPSFMMSQTMILVAALLVISGLIFFTSPSLTGFSVYESGQSDNIIFEDGYSAEGFRWAEIRGLNVYERCMQVSSDIDFSSAVIKAKLTSATNDQGLVMKLYDHDNLKKEPSQLVGSCSVEDYSNLWKSCRIPDLQEENGEYWICASNPQGDIESVYHTIAYGPGQRKTALWTGDNWQKLSDSSYTIKSMFIGSR